MTAGRRRGRGSPRVLALATALSVVVGADVATAAIRSESATGAAGPGAAVVRPSVPGGGSPATTPSSGPSTVSPAAATPCAGTKPPARWSHVLWIWMENKPWSAVVGHRSAATFNRWASRCGVEADYRGITHPSLPNYLAATGGTTAGISSDCSPGPGCTAPGSGIFGQVTAAGGRWASYVESMPANCATAPAGDYAVKHNPAAYYPGLRAACTAQDVPLGRPEAGPLAQALAAGTLPTFSFVTPNMCDDTHDCPVAVGDSWLDRWLRVIVGSPTYREGGLAVFITWDEDDRSAGNHVPLLVIAPSVPAGAVVTQAATHYSLLRTTEDMLGLPPLGHAADATSMRSAFHL